MAVKDILNHRKFTVLQSPPDARDWKAHLILGQETALPLAFDWRKRLRPVRDQGQEGTCLPCATCACREVQENIDCGYTAYFSPQWLYDHRSTTGEGMYPRDMMKILQDIGCVPETDNPYGRHADATSRELLETAKRYQIAGYARITTIDSLKTAIFQSGPCILTFPVYGDSAAAWFWRKNGDLVGGHAVAAVGWDSQGFILRNSWGDSFGDNGYCWFPYEDWACLWEAWTTVDARSPSEQQATGRRDSWWRRCKRFFGNLF